MERYSDQWKRKYRKNRAKRKKIMYGVGATGLLTLSIFLCISQGGSSRFGAGVANPSHIGQDTIEESNSNPLQQEPISMENVDFSSSDNKDTKKVPRNNQEGKENLSTVEQSNNGKENFSDSKPTEEGNGNTSPLEAGNEGNVNQSSEDGNQEDTENKASEDKTNSMQDKGTDVNSELEEQFFKDTIFIGDSRTEGLRDFGKVKGANFYTYRGLMVNTAIGKNYIELKNGTKGNVLDAAKQTSFSKVYLLFGINELGWRSLDIFKENYRSIIEGIREIEPDCEIYIQANYPVTKKMNVGDEIYNNTNIIKFNKVINELAQEEEVAYIDLYAYFADNEGNLPENATPDGVHLNASYFKDWKQCLMEFGDGNTER